MARAPADQIVSDLTGAGLLSSEAARRLDSELRINPGMRQEQFAEKLYALQELTPYQIEQIVQDKLHELFLGDYVIQEPLGRGGMGIVYRALHRRLRRVVALKVLARRTDSDDTHHKRVLSRFEREVLAVGRLNHPNIIAALDAREDRGIEFLVMECADGHDLAWLVRKNGVFSVAQAVDCIKQCARGMEYAHSCNVVHRDIKPSNVLLTRNGVVKILDLGLARLSGTGDGPGGEVEQSVTDSGDILGTIDFMSPEQTLNTKYADARSDIYSLGCTLHFLLTAKPPYRGETTVEKILAHRDRSIPSLRAHRGDISRELDALFRRMVAKLPEDRFQSMTEVLAAFGETPVPEFRETDHATEESEADLKSSTVAWRDTTVHSVTKREPRAGAALSIRNRLARSMGTSAVRSRTLLILGALLLTAFLAGQRHRTPPGSLSLNSAAGSTAISEAKPPQSPTGPQVQLPPQLPKPVIERVVHTPGSPDVGPAENPERSSTAVEPERLLEGHTGVVFALAISHDGRWIASGASDNTIRIWSADRGELSRIITGHDNWVHSLSFNRDSTQLLSASADRTIRLWDFESGMELRRFQGHDDFVYCAVFSPDERQILSGGNDLLAILWNAETGDLVRRIGQHDRAVWSVAFADDRNQVLTAGAPDALQMWNCDSGDLLHEFRGHAAPIMSIAVARGHSRAATAGLDGRVVVWDLNRIEPPLRLDAHPTGARVVAISDAGDHILTGGMDGSLFLWDLRTSQIVKTFKGHSEQIATVALSPRMDFAVSGGGRLQGQDRSIRQWRLE